MSETGCRPDPGKVKAVQNMKPTNAKGVRSFLGMCCFYRKHIPSFAKIVAPLTNLTRKNIELKWTEGCQEAFAELKSRLTQAPVLVRAGVHQPFIVTTDASGTEPGSGRWDQPSDRIFFQEAQGSRVSILGYRQRSLSCTTYVPPLPPFPLGHNIHYSH